MESLSNLDSVNLSFGKSKAIQAKRLAVSIFATLLVSGVGHAQARPSAENVKIYQLDEAGSGCPVGSTQVILAPDVSSFTVLYNNFVTQAGGAQPANSSKACTLKVKILIPRGYSLRVQSADFRGFVSVQPGMVARQNVRIQTGFIELPNMMGFALQQWNGPFTGNYVLNNQRVLQNIPDVSCVQFRDRSQIKIVTDTSVVGGDSGREGMLTVDSVDGRLVQKYNLAWENCIGTIGGILGALGGRR